MATVVEEFVATLGVRQDMQSFANAQVRLRALGAGVQQLTQAFAGVFALNAVRGFVMDLTAQGAALKDATDRLGITTQAYQELGLAAQLSGSSIEGLETGLRFLQRNQQQAVDGSKELASAFKKAGIDLKESNQVELLGQVADAIQAEEDPAKRTALAMKLLGRSGAQLIPMLKDGSAGLAAMRQEAIDLGGGLSDELIANADELDDNLTRLRFSTLALKSTLGNVLLPVIDRVVRGIIAFSKAIQQNLRANRFIQIALTVGTAALVAWGVAAVWAARTTIAAWAKAAAPFLRIVALLTLLVAGLDELHQLLTGGQSLIGEWLDKWNGLGAADKMVRNIAAGLTTINDILTGNTKVSEFFGDMWENTGAAFQQEKASAQFRGQLEAAKAAAASDDPITASIGAKRLAELKAQQGASSLGRNDALRARGRSLDSDQVGIVRGRASADAAAQLRSAAGMVGQNYADYYGVGGATVPIGAGGGTTVNVGDAIVTVTAPAGTDARALERMADRAAARAQARQAENVRRALANRTANGR